MEKNLMKYLELHINERAEELAVQYKEVDVNGKSRAEPSFFIQIAWENILQGIWDGSYDKTTYYFDGKVRTKEVTALMLKKVFNKLITFSENSDEFYWSVIYSFSLRNKSVKSNLATQKLAIGTYLDDKRSKLDYQVRNALVTHDREGTYVASVNFMPYYGTSHRVSTTSDYD